MLAVDILAQHFGPVKVAWKRSDQALVHAPHREDKKASLHLYTARNGNFRVHDYGTGEDMWLDEYIKRYTGQEIRAEWRNAASRKAAAPKQPKVDSRGMAKRFLSVANMFAEPYRGHGFTKVGENKDALTVSSDFEFEGKTIRRGTALFIYRSPTGEPWGVQARATKSNGGRMYWWVVPPEMGVGYSEGWRNATALVVAEGLPKAHAMARLIEEQLRNPSFLYRTGQRKPEEVTVGYIAIAGKGNYRKVVEDLLLWNRSLIILADHDVVAELNNMPHPDTPEGIIKDVYAKRMAVNRRTTIFGQGMLDVNDLLIAHGPFILGMLKRITPKYHDGELKRYVLPMACKQLSQAGMQLLNAYWLYMLSRGKHEWKRGWTLTGSPTYADLAALSGLNMQTVKLQKRKLKELGLIQADDYGLAVLKASVLRKCMLRIPKDRIPKQEKKEGGKKEDGSSSTASSASHLTLLPSGQFLVVHQLDTPSERDKSALLSVIATGGYRRTGKSSFGSTGVFHYSIYLLRKEGWSATEVAEYLGVARQTVYNTMKRIDRAVQNVKYARYESYLRIRRVLWKAAERVKYLYDRYMQWREGVKEAYMDAIGWIKVDQRLKAQMRINRTGPPKVQFGDYLFK